VLLRCWDFTSLPRRTTHYEGQRRTHTVPQLRPAMTEPSLDPAMHESETDEEEESTHMSEGTEEVVDVEGTPTAEAVAEGEQEVADNDAEMSEAASSSSSTSSVSSSATASSATSSVLSSKRKSTLQETDEPDVKRARASDEFVPSCLRGLLFSSAILVAVPVDVARARCCPSLRSVLLFFFDSLLRRDFPVWCFIETHLPATFSWLWALYRWPRQCCVLTPMCSAFVRARVLSLSAKWRSTGGGATGAERRCQDLLLRGRGGVGQGSVVSVVAWYGASLCQCEGKAHQAAATLLSSAVLWRSLLVGTCCSPLSVLLVG
jgi:hypothetical protein